MSVSTDPSAVTALPRVRGRFAPSPTGPLHFGSLIAAIASYLDARSRGGEWLVRIEDLDPPREVTGTAAAILRALQAHGLQWDGQVLYQSGRSGRYAEVLDDLTRKGLVYPCACSRREVADSAMRGIEGPVYPGTCRAGIAAGRSPRSWRVRVQGDTRIELCDEIQGPVRQDVEHEVGDFVLRRADGLFAYQLAVVVDDADQGISRIVRGADLIDSTQRQIYLQRVLGMPTPAYLHVPVAVNAAGGKLSKQALATALDLNTPSAALIAALRFLNQSPPPDWSHAKPQQILDWACERWKPSLIARSRAQPAPVTFV